ncbi:hypothetical protein [Marinobacterium rhizophilum]|uniref:hypothetical protein n=1 Tax=Marinobacterium rhizophilum TaxID=420402 RepID=UPI000361AE21|nr:hypothetical protein [Marinobacterium rhizophilum]
MKESKSFQLKFENIPLLNLRRDFQVFKTIVGELLEEGDHERVLHSTRYHRDAIDLEADFNHWMRLSIMGLESYIKGAVALSPREHGQSEAVRAALKNPVKASAQGNVCKAFYNYLPSLINENYSLLERNNSLYDRNLTFYSEVRHPLFHGYDAAKIQPAGLKTFCDHLEAMYQWIDSWYTLDS